MKFVATGLIVQVRYRYTLVWSIEPKRIRRAVNDRSRYVTLANRIQATRQVSKDRLPSVDVFLIRFRMALLYCHSANQPRSASKFDSKIDLSPISKRSCNEPKAVMAYRIAR